VAYRVLVADNFQFVDPEEPATLGEFETLEAAIEACKGAVDDFLEHEYRSGMTAESLNATYTAFGDNPFIVGEGVAGMPFSARTYAERRATQMCAPTK